MSNGKSNKRSRSRSKPKASAANIAAWQVELVDVERRVAIMEEKNQSGTYWHTTRDRLVKALTDAGALDTGAEE